MRVHEITYNVLMRHSDILSQMYPLDEAKSRYSSAVKQTAAMIQCKLKKGHLDSVKKVSDILDVELLEGKIEISKPTPLLLPDSTSCLIKTVGQPQLD